MGLHALEPTSRPGAANRNVTTANANFGTIEKELTANNALLQDVRAEILQHLGRLDQKATSNEASIKDAVALLTGAIHGNVRSNFTHLLARSEPPNAAPIVVDSSDDEIVPPMSRPSTSARTAPAKAPKKDRASAAASTAALEAELLATVERLEEERELRASAKFMPTSVLTVAPTPKTGLQTIHSAASQLQPPPGFRPVAAPPIVALDTDPQAARIAMLQSRIYDLQGGAAATAQPFLPEIFVASGTSAPRSSGPKRARDESTSSTLDATAAPAPQKRPRTSASANDSRRTSVLRIGPWNFGVRVKDAKAIIEEMINALPNSYMLRGAGMITRCNNRHYIYMQMKTVAEADTLEDAWSARGEGYKSCALVRASPEEVLTVLAGQ